MWVNGPYLKRIYELAGNKEKELWETILSNVKDRSGDVLPIEERMQKSIQNSFDKSDFDLDEVNPHCSFLVLNEKFSIIFS